MTRRTALICFTVLALGTALVLLVWHRDKVTRTDVTPVGLDYGAASSRQVDTNTQLKSAKQGLFQPASACRYASNLLTEIQAAIASGDRAKLDFAMTSLLPELVLIDTPAAAQLAEANQNVQTREELLMRTAQLLAQQDVQGALGWADALTNAVDRDAAISAVCLQVAIDDPAQAVQLRQQFAEQTQPDTLTPCLVQQWAEKDLAGALDWALARLEGKQRDDALARIAFVLAESNPLEAARLVALQIQPGEDQVEAAISVLHKWAGVDPAAAKTWVDLFPEGTVRDRAVAELGGVGLGNMYPVAK